MVGGLIEYGRLCQYISKTAVIFLNIYQYDFN